ncbi:hypothetical protein EJ02DRAFT_459556 [Clathrospora elynae]|uniref:Uncharacterized protein n=1 Tax=Clathrospora elynae TaxID=706981 RepID=A0A6A5S8P7_9PLEO|nr:hypothetical protein EJ02DRAFT_459556 [Clathrospora elynae]
MGMLLESLTGSLPHSIRRFGWAQSHSSLLVFVFADQKSEFGHHSPHTVKLRFSVAVARLNPALPVRSAVLKQCTGGLVVRWVATSESPLFYVFALLFA